ncbi:uncharacterized protein LOC114615721 [Grammomys surdaster]|uniref:uncharacterized protein LOC114615721 n=1 Tax=Grammomys surdaster TaxID=491861 RepID=UPI00109F645C|nr:uncharacterized protein LOC114615721 [Grammomys surdaster]
MEGHRARSSGPSPNSSLLACRAGCKLPALNTEESHRAPPPPRPLSPRPALCPALKRRSERTSQCERFWKRGGDSNRVKILTRCGQQWDAATLSFSLSFFSLSLSPSLPLLRAEKKPTRARGDVLLVIIGPGVVANIPLPALGPAQLLMSSKGFAKTTTRSPVSLFELWSAAVD